MKLFIWKDLDHLTPAYHDGGGAVVIAETLERAREILPAFCEDQSGGPCEESDCPKLAMPAVSCTLTTELAEQLIVFPDAGCC